MAALNRNGMPKPTSTYAAMRITANIEHMSKAYGEEALMTLVKCMRDEDAPWQARTKAADSILDRAYGRSVDRIAIATVDGGTSDAPQTLSTAQLIAALSSTLEHRAVETLEHSQAQEVAEPAETTPGLDLK